MSTKAHLVKATVFPVAMHGCESWTVKKTERQRIDFLNCGVGEDSSPTWRRSCKEIQPIHPKGELSWLFIGRTDAEAETPILWYPDAKSWLIWKDPDAGKDWGQEEKGMTEDEMVGWHHRLNGHGFGCTPGVCDGAGGLECCDSLSHKELGRTERLSWTEMSAIIYIQCYSFRLSIFIHFCKSVYHVKRYFPV